MSEVTMYEVQQGDCIFTIAEGEGLQWKTVWNHPQNSSLKDLRKDPNILMPGDVVAVPKKQIKELAKPTDAKHRFVKKNARVSITIRLLEEDEPRASIPYIFKVNGEMIEGKTDTSGYLTVAVPPTAQTAKLILPTGNDAPDEEFTVGIGSLDPIDEIAGIQKRLQNLGFRCQPTGELDDATKAAIALFRSVQELEGEGIDDELKQSLKAAHGS